MMRVIVRVSVMALLAILPTIPSSAGSFSYSVNVHGHEIVVTGLADGTYSLELDGLIHSPEAGGIEVKADYSLRDPESRKATTETLTVSVRNKGKDVSIMGDEWMLDKFWSGWVQTIEWVSITVKSEKPKEKATLLKIDNKPVYRSHLSLVGHTKKPYPRAADAYFFDYYFNDGQRIIDVMEMQPKDKGESPSPLFTGVVKTMRKRDIVLPPKPPLVQPSSQH